MTLPISGEQAGLARDVIGWAREILGDLPADLVGILAGDPVKALRAKMLETVWQKTKKTLEDRGVEDRQPPSLKADLPILAAAADETNENLQDLWAKLLAAAMDPSRTRHFRQSFIETIRKMDPTDVIVLHAVASQLERWKGKPFGAAEQKEEFAKLEMSTDERSVSVENLIAIRCFTSPGGTVVLTSYGRELLKAVAD